MKKSKLQRKFVNQMRAMGDVPWPARRFKYPATSGRLASRHIELAPRCERKVGETQERRGRLKRKQTTDVLCGGKLVAKLGRTGGRRIYCESCRARERQRKLELRIKQQLQSRFGIVSPSEQAREQSRSARMLAKFRRTGSR